jgi:hypothetical protein
MKSGPDGEVTFAYYFILLTLTAIGTKEELVSTLFTNYCNFFFNF